VVNVAGLLGFAVMIIVQMLALVGGLTFAAQRCRSPGS